MQGAPTAGRFREGFFFALGGTIRIALTHQLRRDLARRLPGDVTLPDDPSAMDWAGVVYSPDLRLSYAIHAHKPVL